jgi:cation:H+ antiporter
LDALKVKTKRKEFFRMAKTKKNHIPMIDLLALVIAPLCALQWPILHSLYPGLPIPWEPLLAGFAIFASAYLLSWAAEVAEVDIPPALALAVLSLVAVAPEYAVDIYFAWQAGKDPSYVQYATANMTGANRILIGLGWTAVVLAFCWKARKKEVTLEPRLRLETSILLVATLYSFILPLKGTLSIWDTAVFFALFLYYFSRLLKGQAHAPTAEGPVAVIQRWKTLPRRAFVLGFFAIAGYTIFKASHPFAEGLLAMGRHWGIDEFLLVQWLAPLASESPEFIVAVLFALKLRATSGFNTIISSTVNQWTLLVGALPLAYVLSKGAISPMVMDARQIEEVFLTSAQSLFAIVIISNLRFSLKEAVVLATLFATQACYPLVEPYVGIDSVHVRLAYAWMYVGFAASILIFSGHFRSDMKRLALAFFKLK